MGSLNADKRFYDYLQNFTAAPFSVVVKPAEEITLSYKFVMNKDLEPDKYQLAHTGDDHPSFNLESSWIFSLIIFVVS